MSDEPLTKRHYVILTDERQEMVKLLAPEFVKRYNEQGIAFGGKSELLNAVILKFILEGFRRYGIAKDKNGLYFDEARFNDAFNNPLYINDY